MKTGNKTLCTNPAVKDCIDMHIYKYKILQTERYRYSICNSKKQYCSMYLNLKNNMLNEIGNLLTNDFRSACSAAH